jgi:hypothetical protein
MCYFPKVNIVCIPLHRKVIRLEASAVGMAVTAVAAKLIPSLPPSLPPPLITHHSAHVR